MGTRGLYGVRKNGIDKAAYNHFDSYPDCLGRNILKFIASNPLVNLHNFFDNIEIIDPTKNPTDEQIKYCVENGYFNKSVSNGDDTNWYCLLRNLQGNFEEYQRLIDEDKKIFMQNEIDFIKDSLFCEYAYIINLDEGFLEFYIGFQEEPDPTNRYRCKGNRGYYPCKLVLSIPLSEIKEDNIQKWIGDMNKSEEE